MRGDFGRGIEIFKIQKLLYLKEEKEICVKKK
jgi:hypothetical protein